MVADVLADTADSRCARREIHSTFDDDLKIIFEQNIKERVMVKWVFGHVVVREGEVLAGEKDWLGLCASYIATLYGAHKGTPHPYTVFWKCPKHGFPFLGGYCPGLRPETIVNANSNVDAAISHCQDYRIYELRLHVGFDPRLRHELHPNQLQQYTSIPIFSQEFRQQFLSSLAANNTNANDIKGNDRRWMCRYCSKAGHNRRTCHKISKRTIASTT